VAYVPHHQSQLGRGTPVPGGVQGSRDCGPRTLQVGLDALSEGELIPGIPAIRKAMEKPGPQTTNVVDFARAVPDFEVKGRGPLRYTILRAIDEVEDAVDEGRYVHLCIDYGVFNRVAEQTGDPNFRGGHSVGVIGERREVRVPFWRLFDPLDDARRQGIPRGPRWVKKEHLVKAMEAFAGSQGRAWAGRFSGGREL
jgi:hypothetical protein